MTNSELFTAAHKLARTYEGDYRACFVLALQTLKTTDMRTIEELTEKVNTADVINEEGRQLVANSCSELYNLIEDGLYNKYGEEAMLDAYNDLCKGNFAEPFMCEQKKSKFELYSTIYINKVA